MRARRSGTGSAWCGFGRCWSAAIIVAATAGLCGPAFGGSAAAVVSRAVRRTPIVEAVEKVRDAVVNISSTTIIERRGWDFGGLFDDIFEWPFARPRLYEAHSVGSGFVVYRTGYIVTNAHVVARTAQRTVTFADGRNFEAKIVALDERHDLAVLKIEAGSDLKTAVLGHSDDLMIGETAIAIGNPFGFQHTVTVGVISAVGRELKFGNGVVYKNLIQTDAAINPGNSGGPLLNILGEVVGINTAMKGDAQNIGFAIPVDDLRKLLPEMLDPERLRRVRIGFTVKGTEKVIVSSIDPDGPAAKAGLEPGDRVLQIDGQPVRQDLDVCFVLADKQPGQVVDLKVLRDGTVKDIRIRVVAKPKPDGAKLAWAKLGIMLRTLTKKQAARWGLRPDVGLLIVAVQEDGPAARAGIEPGDILFRLNRYPVSTLEDVGLILEQVEPGEAVFVGILRIRPGVLFQTGTVIKAR